MSRVMFYYEIRHFLNQYADFIKKLEIRIWSQQFRTVDKSDSKKHNFRRYQCCTHINTLQKGIVKWHMYIKWCDNARWSGRKYSVSVRQAIFRQFSIQPIRQTHTTARKVTFVKAYHRSLPSASPKDIPDSEHHGANVGPTWSSQDPGGPHVGHTNLAIWESKPGVMSTIPSLTGSACYFYSSYLYNEWQWKSFIDKVVQGETCDQYNI